MCKIFNIISSSLVIDKEKAGRASLRTLPVKRNVMFYEGKMLLT
jgi:hypothetical protein